MTKEELQKEIDTLSGTMFHIQRKINGLNEAIKDLKSDLNTLPDTPKGYEIWEPKEKDKFWIHSMVEDEIIELELSDLRHLEDQKPFKHIFEMGLVTQTKEEVEETIAYYKALTKWKAQRKKFLADNGFDPEWVPDWDHHTGDVKKAILFDSEYKKLDILVTTTRKYSSDFFFFPLEIYDNHLIDWANETFSKDELRSVGLWR